MIFQHNLNEAIASYHNADLYEKKVAKRSGAMLTVLNKPRQENERDRIFFRNIPRTIPSKVE